MIRVLAPLVACLPLSLAAQDFTAPSGLTLSVAEVLLEEETRFARFRFVAPTLGQDGAAFDDVHGDLVWMCETFAVPALTQSDWDAAQIVVSVADRDVPFGTMDADAVQYFAGFSTDGATCTEELF